MLRLQFCGDSGVSRLEGCLRERGGESAAETESRPLYFYALFTELVWLQECKGSLAWRESFACLKNTSLSMKLEPFLGFNLQRKIFLGNNLIETDRKCVIVQGVDRVCRGRKHPNLFGDCLLCQFDECNGEDVENGSIVNRLNFKLFCAIITVIVVALNNVKCQR